MGLFDWLFPGPDAKIRKARALIEKREFNDARWLVEGLDHPQAGAVRDEALAGMIALNLDAAESALERGERDVAAEHLELARELGATPDQLRRVRRVRAAAPPPKPAPEPSPPPALEGDDPIWSLPPDDPRLRYAQLVESWPEPLQPRLLALGAEFASAALAIDEGGAEEAWEVLGRFTSQDPVAHYERARAALALGRSGHAAGELRRFGEKVGHTRVGNVHTAALLAQLLQAKGEGADALAVVDASLGESPTDMELRFARANALLGLDRFEDAETEAALVIRRAGKVMPAWRLLARARLGRGDRAGAIAALEGGLAAYCGSPGKCGNQALDVDAARMLARLYAEQGDQQGRVSQLLGDIGAAQGGLSPEDQDIARLAGQGAPA